MNDNKMITQSRIIEEYVCKVLTMIVNQSIKLDKEIEIPSRKYVVEL